MKRKLAVGIGIIATTVAMPAAAEASSDTIKTNAYQVTQLGPFKTKAVYRNNYHRLVYSPTIGAATRAFGQPSSKFKKQGCVVKWKRLGLRNEFQNYGVPSGSVCSANGSVAQSFTIEGSGEWQTWKGLRIGMTEAQLEEMHPAAEYVGGHDYFPASYWLRQNWSPIGDGGDYPILSATVDTNIEYPNAPVKRFYGWIGAAGE